MARMLSAIDVLTICPLDIELDALREALGAQGFKMSREDPIHDQCKEMTFARSVSSTSFPGVLTVCVMQTRHQGVLRTACTTTDLIEKLRPKLVISFGIAGLFEATDYKLGDVCVPESIYYYEPAKDAEEVPVRARVNSRRARGPARKAPSRRLYAPIVYSTDVIGFQHPSTSGQFKVALDRPIASGEKLIAAVGSPTKEEARDMNRHMVGVEMEAAGVAEACRSTPTHRRPRFIAIKGFSDLATAASKNPTAARARAEQDAMRRRAAQNAATYLAKFLQQNNETIEQLLPAGRYRDSSWLAERTERLKAIVVPSSTMAYFPPDHRLQRPLLVGAAPIIYHFIVRSDGLISWVDVYFLLIQKRIRDELGLCPHIFISEPDDHAPTSVQKQGIHDLLDRLFGGRSYALYWSSDVRRSETQYRQYAERCRAVRPDFFNRLRDANDSTTGMDWSEHKTDRWLVFIIWLSRVLPVQCILAFERRRELYEKLHLVPGLDPVIIYGKTLRLADLDELSSRFSSRIMSLGVDSSSIAPMLDWFGGEFRRNPDEARSIAKNFSAHFHSVLGNSSQNQERERAIVGELESKSGINLGDAGNTLAELAHVLVHIESNLFESART